MVPAAIGGSVAAAIGCVLLTVVAVRRRRRRALAFKQFEDDNAPLPATMPGLVPGLRTAETPATPGARGARTAVVESPLQMEMTPSTVHASSVSVAPDSEPTSERV